MYQSFRHFMLNVGSFRWGGGQKERARERERERERENEREREWERERMRELGHRIDKSCH